MTPANHLLASRNSRAAHAGLRHGLRPGGVGAHCRGALNLEINQRNPESWGKCAQGCLISDKIAAWSIGINAHWGRLVFHSGPFSAGETPAGKLLQGNPCRAIVQMKGEPSYTSSPTLARSLARSLSLTRSCSHTLSLFRSLARSLSPGHCSESVPPRGGEGH